jgi:hypothetical protein
MTNALLHELGKSRSFGRLSLRAKVLWPMLLATSDDQGRGTAEPDAIKWYVCPNVSEIDIDDVPDLLSEMDKQGMVLLYECPDNGPAYQVVRWWEYQKHQWARPSKWTAPDGWTDRIRYSNRGDYHENVGWATTGGFDAEDLTLSKTKSGKHDPEFYLENEVENSVDFQPNLTEPNLTQPNLTQPPLDKAHSAVSEPPGPVLIDDTPTIPAKSTSKGVQAMPREQFDTPDPALAAVWQTFLVEMSGQVSKQVFGTYYTGISPGPIADGCVYIGVTSEPAYNRLQYTDQPAIKRTLGSLLSKPVDVTFQVIGVAG